MESAIFQIAYHCPGCGVTMKYAAYPLGFDPPMRPVYALSPVYCGACIGENIIREHRTTADTKETSDGD